MGGERKVHPECLNASNPYHECVEYCFNKITEAKERLQQEEGKDLSKIPEERTVHPDCINAANPYHECSEFCFRRIAEAKDLAERTGSEIKEEDNGSVSPRDAPPEQKSSQAEQADCSDGQKDGDAGYPVLNERQKKLFELSLKMNEAKKANRMAIAAEKNRLEAPTESRGISKQKWMEERKKRIGKLLDANGLEMSKAYMLDTQENAEAKYKKWEKDPAPFGWDGEHITTDTVTQPATIFSPIFGPQTSTSRRSRTGNFTTEEDKMLISAWLNVSMDAVHANEHGHKQFWARILEFYTKYKNFESDRTHISLMHRWSNIQLATKKFCGCYAQIEARCQSRIDERDKIQNAKELYKSLHNSSGFQFEHCWNELRNEPKWLEHCMQKKKDKIGKNVVSSDESYPSTPEVMSFGEDASPTDIERPLASKAVKERLKRKGKGCVDEESNGQIYELFKDMKEQNARLTDKKIEMLEKTYKQEREKVEVQKARLEHEQEKFRMEHEKFRHADEERIMLIDVDTLPPIQASYYRRRQREILDRGL